MMTFFGSGPSAATIPSASRIAGNAKNTSITRPITMSAMPPRYPDTSPRTLPTSVAAATDNTATCMERRAPNSTRLKRSRPSASVPNGNAAVGAARRSDETWSGSRSGRKPTPSAIAAYATTIRRPARATGSRAIAASRRVWPGPRTAALREADSGIQVAIQQIHKNGERHEEDRDREDPSLNQCVVALHDGGEQHAADTRDGEDLLDDDRASKELADLYPEKRHHHDEPVLEHMPSQHEPRPQALRSRRADVVSAQHVEHRRARHPHRRGREREAECDRWEKQELQIAEGVAHEVDVAAGVREPAKIQREQDDDERAEPEARQREPDQATDPREDVETRAAAHRRQQPERYPDRHGDERRGGRELERRGQPLRDLDQDGTARPYGVARVAPEERRQPCPVLNVKRLIEP